jgi:hypothetical protein
MYSKGLATPKRKFHEPKDLTRMTSDLLLFGLVAG